MIDSWSRCSSIATSSAGTSAYALKPGVVENGLLLGLLLLAFTGEDRPDFAPPLRKPTPSPAATGDLSNPPFSACSTYRAYVAISVEPSARSLFERGRGKLGLKVP